MRRQLLAATIIVLFCLAVGLKEPRFFTSMNVESILLWMPLITVAALGQLLVILTGGIDISIGSILGCTGIAVGLILKAQPNLPVPLAFLAGALGGLVLGMINASLVTFAKVPALIATIGTLAAFRGLAFMLSGGSQIDSTTLPDSLLALASHGIPVYGAHLNWLLLIALILSVFVACGLKWTRAGRNLFAFGSNPDAAYLRGISPARVNFAVYSLCGLFAGVAGVMYASRFGFVNPSSAGQNFELTVIAAVAIGGAKLTGGAGSVLGAILGCLLLSCINVGLSVLGINENWQLLTYGVVIIVAILVDGLATKRGAR